MARRGAWRGCAIVMKGARGGFTLVEVMLAGAITVLVTLSLMEGLIVSAKISHENSELLAADAFAWDTAWRWLNTKNDDIDNLFRNSPSGIKDLLVSAGAVIPENDCRAIYLAGSPARCYVRIVGCGGTNAGTNALPRCETTVEAKRIDVNVEWGPADKRKSLNDLCGRGGVANYGHPISLYKGKVERSDEQ